MCLLDDWSGEGAAEDLFACDGFLTLRDEALRTMLLSAGSRNFTLISCTNRVIADTEVARSKEAPSPCS